MSSELEARLTQALRRLAPSADASARAKAAALESVAPVPRRVRARFVGGGFLVAATVTAGVGMAATGHLVSDADRTTVTRPVLTVPEGAPAVAALVGDRAWVATASGVRTSRPATAVELSPAGLFVAFGSPGALTATELDGDQRWSVRVQGEVVSIAWAPYPTYIAYVVRRGTRHELRVIWANGRHDRLIARGVSSRRPRWWADTGALDYTGADGRTWTWEREPDRVRPSPP